MMSSQLYHPRSICLQLAIRSYCDDVAYDWGYARFDRWRYASYNIGGARGGQSIGSVGLVQVEI